MKFFDTVSGNLTKAVDFVVEKNRKAALINRIRIVIKNERENEARAYVALGKYYYEHLRDKENEETEHLCRAVDFSDGRIKKAFDKLDELTEPEGCEDGCGEGCEDGCADCCSCGCGAGEEAAPEDEPEDEPEADGAAGASAGAADEEAAEDEPLDPGV